MKLPNLDSLPPPPAGKTGWPWTTASPSLPATLDEGRPWPLISIVTPSYNQGPFIEETIRSVLLQGYPNLEYHVMDGGSTDESVGTIERYAPWLTSWVSERDRGQAHAINKGFALSGGEVFQWINSDDLLAPAALQTVAARCPVGGVLAGAVHMFGDGIDRTERNQELSVESLLAGGATFCQPALWLSRTAAACAFPLDESLHYAFDFEMVLRILARGARVVYEPGVLAHFRFHEASKTVAQHGRWTGERVRILQKALADDAFAPFHATCAKALRRTEWQAEVEAIRAGPRSHAVLALMSAMAKDPLTRIDRHTLGALRRELAKDLGALLGAWIK